MLCVQVLDEPIEVLHVDEEVVVVSKPCSIPVHPISRFKASTRSMEQHNLVEATLPVTHCCVAAALSVCVCVS